MWGIVVVASALALWSAWRDPRTLRTGVFLLVAVIALTLRGVGWLLDLLPQPDQDEVPIAAWVLLGAVLSAVVLVLVLAVYLVLNGVTMVRKEGRRPANLLALVLGVGLLMYVGVALWSLRAEQAVVAAVSLLVGLPAAYFAFVFSALLLYGWLYRTVAFHRMTPVSAVVVLGAGLVRGRVPPLLAGRLDLGQAVLTRCRAAGLSTVLVTSGGQGPDEPTSEARAMTGYLLEKGVDRSQLLTEDESTTTQENLRLSRRVLADAGIDGQIAVVTNDFHAFRAAMLMRREGMPGYALGAPSARYYRPSATIREFVAVLRDHLVINVVMGGVAVLPLVLFVTTSVVRAISA